jgi:hypothetical protein
VSLSITITNLTNRRDAIAAELSAFTTSSGEGPNFSLDGVSVDWPAYRIALLNEWKELNILLDQLNGPCVITTIGR